MADYREQAIACVSGYVLPRQRQLYAQSGGDLDRMYSMPMDDEMYTHCVVEPGRVYSLGYPRCTCPRVLSGEVTDPEHCQCTKQSILYILRQLEPESRFTVEILDTVLRGGESCRFRITRETK